MAASNPSTPATSAPVSIPASRTSPTTPAASSAVETTQQAPVTTPTTSSGRSTSVPPTTSRAAGTTSVPGSTTNTATPSPPIITDPSSTLPVTTPGATTDPASSSAPVSTIPSSTSAPITTDPTTSTSPTTSSAPTSAPVTTPTGPASTSIVVSSDSSRGTIYSTTVVYVSVTDSRGSSYLSSTALTGGSGQLDSNNKGGNDPNIGAIVGGVVGGVVGAAVLGALAFFYWRKKRQPKASALDEKMFDPSRTARHSGGPNMPVDLIGDGPTGGNDISPYTAGTGSKAASAAAWGGVGGTAGMAGAYHHSREPSDPRYAYPSRASFDSTVYSGTTDPYLNNMAGFGTGMAAAAGPNGRSRGGPPAAGGFSDGYGGSSSGHDHGHYASTPQSPGNNNRRSGGWGVAAAMSNDMPGDHGGYHSRDYAIAGYPRGEEDSPFHEPPMPVAGSAGNSNNRMSASAMAKLREARGQAPYPDGDAAGPVGSHGRRPSSQGPISYRGAENEVDDNYGNHQRRSSNGLSRTSEGDHGAQGGNGASLVVHDDGGPIHEDEEDRAALPAELPPTYDSVPRGAR